VLDEAGTLDSRVNHDMVEMGELEAQDVDLLKRLIREHEEKTASARARTILVQWEEFLPRFRKVAPRNASALVAATREAYLQAAQAEPGLELARRIA
jgi:glutamate synthase (NADPH) large chain